MIKLSSCYIFHFLDIFYTHYFHFPHIFCCVLCLFLSGPLFTLCSQAEYRILHLAQDTTPGAELTRLGYPYQTSGSTECARAIVASNYRGGGPQASERLSMQGWVEIEGICGGVRREQTNCEGSLWLSDQSCSLQSSKEEEITWDIKAEESPVATYTSFILQSSSHVRTTI